MPKTSRSEHYRREVSRVEGFSDAVFALAVTLLVVSLDVPKTFHDLLLTMRGIPAFAVCFGLLYQVWWRHYRFFRSFDLEDGFVIGLTGILLFVVLLYIYPLKFLWSLFFANIQGQRINAEVMKPSYVPALFVIYSGGAAVVFSVLAALYAHAYRLRDALELTALEALDARVQIYRNLGIAGVACASVAIAVVFWIVAPASAWATFAGWIYPAVGLTEWAAGAYEGRERRRLSQQTHSAAG